MNCLDFRRDYRSDPYHLDDAHVHHMHACEACARFVQRQRAWDHRLEAAMRVRAPEGLASDVIFTRSMHHRRRWGLLAVAASVVLALGVLSALMPWQTPGIPAPEFIAHMHKDPLEMKPEMPDADTVLARVSGQLNIKPVAGLGAKIIRVKLCDVDGHMGAHMVLEHNGMRATAFIMPGVEARKIGWTRFDGMDAKLVQTGQGMIAVFCPDHEMTEKLAQRLSSALNWGQV